jgi:putative ABC transport system permease protein
MAGLVTNSLYVWGDRTSLPFRGLTPGRFVNLTSTDAVALEQSIPGIEAVAPRVSLSSRGGADLVTHGDRSGSFNVSGDLPTYIRIQPELVAEGRFLNQLDVDRARKVVVIGAHVVEVLFPGHESPIGQSLRIKGTDFMVVGVVHPSAKGDRGDRLANTIHTPLSTFQAVLRPGPYVQNLAVLLRPGASSDDVEKQIRDKLGALHHFAPEDKQAVETWNTEKEFSKIDGLFKGISLLIWFVGAVTLAAGIIGVSNIMAISVRERTREIGVRRAIGATPWSIVSQLLKESTFLTSVAGVLGLVSGFGLLELVGALMRSGGGGKSMFTPPTADFGVAVAATAAVIAGGALAGLFPALHAVRVRPVVALRDE